MAYKQFPRYLPHPFGRDGKWAVSLFDGRGAWTNSSEAKSIEHAKSVAKNANRRLRQQEKMQKQLGEQIAKAIQD